MHARLRDGLDDWHHMRPSPPDSWFSRWKLELGNLDGLTLPPGPVSLPLAYIKF